MKTDIYKDTKQLIEAGIIKMVKDMQGYKYGIIRENENIVKYYPIKNAEFVIALKKLFLKQFDIFPNETMIGQILEVMEMEFLEHCETISLHKRIYNENGVYAYELERETNTVVCIENGEVFLGQSDDIYFKHSQNYANQVTPNFKTDKSKLFELVKKHFKLKTENDIKLLTLYIVTSLWGLNISHPMIIFVGEKGASKSTTIRKLEKLIDPKSSDLCGIPKGNDGLELRLANTYFVSLDNLSNLSRSMSDTLARAVTGGAVTKRALYENTAEVVLDIKALVAMNGVSLVARESDLLDRSLIITLERISPNEMKTEAEIWKSFEKDRPKILGACFLVLAEALNDTSPLEANDLIRMTDFHVACEKVGRALGLSAEEVSELLWLNQKNINEQSLNEDMVGLCIMELMSERHKYKNSVTGLLCDLVSIAEENGISVSVLPKTPNHLSKRINKIKSSLEAECGIFYEIKNIGTFKEIRMVKK